MLTKQVESLSKNYYKVRQLFYYVRHGLLQIATGIATGIAKCDEFITNCDRYYKLRQYLPLSLNIKIILLGLSVE